ncbi:NADH dehydrogenase 1, alpha/beta subcomplex subunit 1 ndufab1/ACP [Cladochytrium tenue]|nr:NADH dehydrogenase 1, alpha/beta subcomplex subunit 1 ndufab1/ACP [Cladochytrium tenue]
MFAARPLRVQPLVAAGRSIARRSAPAASCTSVASRGLASLACPRALTAASARPIAALAVSFSALRPTFRAAASPSVRHYSGHAEPPTKAQIEERILQVLKDFDKVDASKLTLDAHFYNDLGLDSLDQVEIAIAIEEEFNIEIPDRDADEILSARIAVEKPSKIMDSSREGDDAADPPPRYAAFLLPEASSTSAPASTARLTPIPEPDGTSAVFFVPLRGRPTPTPEPPGLSDTGQQIASPESQLALSEVDLALARQLAAAVGGDSPAAVADQLRADEELARRLAAEGDGDGGDHTSPPSSPGQPARPPPSDLYSGLRSGGFFDVELDAPREVAFVFRGDTKCYKLELPAQPSGTWSTSLLSLLDGDVVYTLHRPKAARAFSLQKPRSPAKPILSNMWPTTFGCLDYPALRVTRVFKLKGFRYPYTFIGPEGLQYSWEDESLFRSSSNVRRVVAHAGKSAPGGRRRVEVFEEGWVIADLVIATLLGILILELD